MKKLALTSLLAVFAVSGAHAANVIDGNPLYLPKAGHFYSVTTLGSHTEGTPYALGEEFGYGITNKLAVVARTSLKENKAFEEYSWDDLSIGAFLRAFDAGAWKMDILAGYSFDHLYGHPKVLGRDAWFDEDNTWYTWTAGVRGGYTTSLFTIAGHANFNYKNFESFNWNEEAGKQGEHTLALGLDAQYVIDSHWSVLAGAEYTGRLDKKVHGAANTKIKNAGIWKGTFGVNYNIDATKFVGLYVDGALNHLEGDHQDEWGWNDGFGFGAKFGIDF